MFSFAALTVLALAALSAASPTSQLAKRGVCNTGSVQCCNTVQPAADYGTDFFDGLLPIVLKDLNTPVATDCTPLSVTGVTGGNSCQAQTVCCDNMVNGNDSIGVGCAPTLAPTL